jgi:hypothetical protein
LLGLLERYQNFLIDNATLEPFKDHSVVELQELIDLKTSCSYCNFSNRILSIAKGIQPNKSINSIVTEHVLDLFINVLEG